MTTEEITAWKKNFPNILEKARSKANRRYPSILEIDDDAEFGEHDINEAKRDIFIEGYLEAEKDLGWISVKDRLPEEHSFKPTQEHLDALDTVYKTHGADSACRHILLNLLNQLKSI